MPIGSWNGCQVAGRPRLRTSTRLIQFREAGGSNPLAPTFLETSPSANASQRFLIVGTEVSDRQTCLTDRAKWGDTSSDSQELLSALVNTWFESRRRFRVSSGRGRAEEARAAGRGAIVLGEIRADAPPANRRKPQGREAGVRLPDHAQSSRPGRRARGLPASRGLLRSRNACISARRRVEFRGTAGCGTATEAGPYILGALRGRHT